MTIKINFQSCDEFEKDFKYLFKKYPSLDQDFLDVKKALEVCSILPQTERINNLGADITIPVYKMRKIYCDSLKSNSKLRIIYIYDNTKNEIIFIQFIEIYIKGKNDNENRKRIEKYVRMRQ